MWVSTPDWQLFHEQSNQVLSKKMGILTEIEHQVDSMVPRLQLQQEQFENQKLAEKECTCQEIRG